MIGRFQPSASACPFGVAGGSDNHNPTDVIAQIYAERPRAARPRLLREARAALQGGAREVRRARRERCSGSPAASDAQAKAAAATVIRMENDARRGVARQRRAARSEGHRSQDDVRRAAEADAALRLDGVLQARPASRPATLNVAEPKFLQEVDRQLDRDACRRLEDVSEVAAARLGGAVAVGRFRAARTSRSTARI